jgi:hypothetical protein
VGRNHHPDFLDSGRSNPARRFPVVLIPATAVVEQRIFDAIRA